MFRKHCCSEGKRKNTYHDDAILIYGVKFDAHARMKVGFKFVVIDWVNASAPNPEVMSERHANRDTNLNQNANTVH